MRANQAATAIARMARSYKSLVFLCNEVIAACAVAQSGPIRPEFLPGSCTCR